MIERLLILLQKMESKPQLPTHLDYLLEKISRALVPLVFVKAFATQENLKSYSKEIGRAHV
jgi:hypothetical protein